MHSCSKIIDLQGYSVLSHHMDVPLPFVKTWCNQLHSYYALMNRILTWSINWAVQLIKAIKCVSIWSLAVNAATCWCHWSANLNYAIMMPWRCYMKKIGAVVSDKHWYEDIYAMLLVLPSHLPQWINNAPIWPIQYSLIYIYIYTQPLVRVIF